MIYHDLSEESVRDDVSELINICYTVTSESILHNPARIVPAVLQRMSLKGRILVLLQLKMAALRQPCIQHWTNLASHKSVSSTR